MEPTLVILTLCCADLGCWITKGLDKRPAGEESPLVMGTGQCVLLCNTSWLSRGVERGTQEGFVASGAAAVGPVLQSCVAHPSIDY